jgi:DHA1 family bicyclomycin/chloramphenicol resistance-like MFS transporter
MLRTSAPGAGRANAIGFLEFVLLCAAMMSSQALAVDAMLPALPTIVRSLHVANENHGQWVVTAYIVGIGLGQLIWGLLSDRYGRRPILLVGLALYVLAAVSCGLAHSFSAMLVWRLLHGFSAASVVVVRSVVRDLYSGRRMARVMSLTFVVFLMIPVIAPSLGQLILLLAPWRSIFLLFGLFGSLVWVWALLRLPETLHPEYRLTLTGAHLAGAVRLVLGDRTSLWYTLAGALIFGSVLAYIGMVEQIFAESFHREHLMPSMFALCAVFMGVASFCNSKIVERVGMRPISHVALVAFIAVTFTHLAVAALGLERIWTFVALQAITMACVSLTVANFGAMAMEPVGAVAGIGASLQGFISTLGSAAVGALIGRQFTGYTTPLPGGALACGLAGLCCVLVAEQGKLFRPHPVATDAQIGAA